MEQRTPGQNVSKLVGITKATDPTRLLLESPTLSVLLPSYDFVKADFGVETGGEIHLEFRRHLVVLSGRNLEKLFRAFHLNEVAAVSETPAKANLNSADCVVSRIVVAPLSTAEDADPNRESSND